MYSFCSVFSLVERPPRLRVRDELMYSETKEIRMVVVNRDGIEDELVAIE